MERKFTLPLPHPDDGKVIQSSIEVIFQMKIGSRLKSCCEITKKKANIFNFPTKTNDGSVCSKIYYYNANKEIKLQSSIHLLK